MKLVREPGGEAIADTSWSVLDQFRRSGARKRRRLRLDGAGRRRLHDHRQEPRPHLPARFHRRGRPEPGGRGPGHRGLGRSIPRKAPTDGRLPLNRRCTILSGALRRRRGTGWTPFRVGATGCRSRTARCRRSSNVLRSRSGSSSSHRSTLPMRASIDLPDSRANSRISSERRSVSDSLADESRQPVLRARPGSWSADKMEQPAVLAREMDRHDRRLRVLHEPRRKHLPRQVPRPAEPFGAVATPPAGNITIVTPSFSSRTASWRTAILFFTASLVSEKSIGSA